jgi:hypothetical protein
MLLDRTSLPALNEPFLFCGAFCSANSKNLESDSPGRSRGRRNLSSLWRSSPELRVLVAVARELQNRESRAILRMLAEAEFQISAKVFPVFQSLHLSAANGALSSEPIDDREVRWRSPFES